jgi:hypothetical protein
MRTNIEVGALSSIDPADMKTVEGGIAIAFDSRAGSVLAKLAEEISRERFGPTIDGPIDIDRGRLYP